MELADKEWAMTHCIMCGEGRDGVTGSRNGFKNRRGKPRVGSNPSPGTKSYKTNKENK